MLRRILLSAALLVSAAAGAFPGSSPPHPELVPSSLLSGNRIHVPGWGCSVEAPSDEWRWFHTTGAPADTRSRGYSEPYFALNPGVSPSLGFYVAAHTHGTDPDKSYMLQLQAELRRITEARGAAFGDWKQEPSSIPLPHSQRYTYTVTRKDGTIWRDFGYVGGTDRKIIFTTESRDSEPPLFAAFVRSLQVTDVGER